MQRKHSSTEEALGALKKEEKDFCAKYQALLKKYDASLLVKARRVIEGRKETKTVSLPDAESTRKEIRKEISYTLDHVTEELGDIKSELTNPKHTDIGELEAVRLTMRYIRRDIPDLLSKRNFGFPLDVLRAAYDSDGAVIISSMKRVVKLKEQEIILLFSFLHATYKALPNMIKGDENSDEKRTR
jgi:hypothetical protein